MPFVTIGSVAVGDPTRASDFNNAINDLNYFSTAAVLGLSKGTTTAATTTGQVILTAGANLTITVSGQNLEFNVNTGAGGVTSIYRSSTLTGAISLSSSNALTITQAAQDFTFNVPTGALGVAGIHNATSTAAAVVGEVVLTATGIASITVSGQNFTWNVNTQVSSIANTSSGSTISGSIILQPGTNIGITVSGQTFNFTSSAGGVASTQPCFFAYFSSGNGTLSTNAWTKAPFNSVLFDTTNGYDNATNFRWTPSQTGKYLICAQLGIRPLLSTNVRGYIGLFKNGSITASGNYRYAVTNAALDITPLLSVINEVTTITDYFEIFARPSASSTLSVSIDADNDFVTLGVFFCGTRVSA